MPCWPKLASDKDNYFRGLCLHFIHLYKCCQLIWLQIYFRCSFPLEFHVDVNEYSTMLMVSYSYSGQCWARMCDRSIESVSDLMKLFILTPAVTSCDFESPCSWSFSNHSSRYDWRVTSPQQHRSSTQAMRPVSDHSEGSSDGKGGSTVTNCVFHSHF